MHKIAVGIDISKDKFDVAIYQDKRYQNATFSNDKEGFRSLVNFLKKRKANVAPICMEATGRYGDHLARFLYDRDLALHIVNPTRIKKYGESQLNRNKTDRADARVIAHFCATQEMRPWTPPPPEVEELQALVRRLDTLKEARTREVNRSKSLLSSEVVLSQIKKHIEFINEQIVQIEKEIEDHIDKHPTLKKQHDLLTSISGIGSTTAITFMAEIPRISDFETAAQLAAYIGLTPRNHESGSSVKKPGKLTKQGNRRLRTAFYFPAITARRYNPIVQDLANRMEASGKCSMSIIGACMRKLVHSLVSAK